MNAYVKMICNFSISYVRLDLICNVAYKSEFIFINTLITTSTLICVLRRAPFLCLWSEVNPFNFVILPICPSICAFQWAVVLCVLGGVTGTPCALLSWLGKFDVRFCFFHASVLCLSADNVGGCHRIHLFCAQSLLQCRQQLPPLAILPARHVGQFPQQDSKDNGAGRCLLHLGVIVHYRAVAPRRNHSRRLEG